MDSVDLLAREDEFKKLNKQLEKKTESLMKQIEQAMQKQDIFSEFSHSLLRSPKDNFHAAKHCCGTPASTQQSTPVQNKNTPKKTQNSSNLNEKPSQDANKGRILNAPPSRIKSSLSLESQSEVKKGETSSTRQTLEPDESHTNSQRVICECCSEGSRRERLTADLQFLHAFVEVSVLEKVLPHSFLKDRATVEGVCKFLSSKVKLMQEQIDRLQSTIDKKLAQCEVHLTNQAELEGERLGLLNKCNNHKATAADMRAKYAALQKRFEEKERQYKEQRSETDKLTCELKKLRSKCTGLEARCASAEDNVDNLRQQLEVAKRNEKEYRECTRSATTSHQNATSKLESRIKSLTSRCDKQEKLIHNLREQRALLMADGAVKALESEFNAFLMKDL